MNLKSVFTAGALVGVGMLVGRVLGLFREMLLASHFGASREADMAIVLLIISEFISNSLVSSAALGALVPAFFARERSEAIALFWQALMVSVLLFVGIAVLIFLQQEHLFSLLNKDAASIPEASLALLLTLCSLPFTAATAILTAYLQYRGRFTAPAFANAIFNIVVIFALWWLPSGLALLAGGILVATLIRLGAHIWAFLRDRAKLPKSFLHPWHMKKSLLKAYGATTGTGILGLLPFYVLYAIAAASSSVALFNYSFKLVLLPAMLVQTVVQMVLLPWFLKFRADNDAQTSSDSYSLTLQVAWILSLAVCLSLSLVSPPIVQLCFGYGKMTAVDIAQVAHLFAIGMWAMPGMVLTSVWQQILYANSHTRAPLIANLLQLVLLVPLCLAGQHFMGEAGILAAYAVLQLLPVIMLAKEAHKKGLVQSYRPSGTYGLMTLAVVTVFIPAAGVFYFLALSKIAALALAILIGLVSLAAGLAACRPIRKWGLAWIR